MGVLVGVNCINKGTKVTCKTVRLPEILVLGIQSLVVYYLAEYRDCVNLSWNDVSNGIFTWCG